MYRAKRAKAVGVVFVLVLVVVVRQDQSESWVGEWIGGLVDWEEEYWEQESREEESRERESQCECDLQNQESQEEASQGIDKSEQAKQSKPSGRSSCRWASSFSIAGAED